MALNNSKLAYETEFDILDRALDSPNGIRIPVTTRTEGLRQRNLLNYARVMDRRESKEIKPIGDPMYGRSVYDTLHTTLREVEGRWWLYISERKAPHGIEELTEDQANT